MRTALFDRIRDKEASIRIQAATALARLQSADDEVDQSDGKTITKKLLWLLQHDPSAYVAKYRYLYMKRKRMVEKGYIYRINEMDISKIMFVLVRYDVLYFSIWILQMKPYRLLLNGEEILMLSIAVLFFLNL